MKKELYYYLNLAVLYAACTSAQTSGRNSLLYHPGHVWRHLTEVSRASESTRQ